MLPGPRQRQAVLIRSVNRFFHIFREYIPEQPRTSRFPEATLRIHSGVSTQRVSGFLVNFREIEHQADLFFFDRQACILFYLI